MLDFQIEQFGEKSDDGIVGRETAKKLGLTLPDFDFGNAISGGKGYPASGTPTIPSVFISKSDLRAFAKQPTSGSRRLNYDNYITAFTSPKGRSILAKYGISKNLNRQVHFFAQAAHETGKFSLIRESLNYTKPATIRRAWESRASKHTDAWIKANLVRKPSALAAWAYNGRMENRKGTTDGFDFRGGGTFQITGREQYRQKGNLIGVDLANDPSQIANPIISLAAACAEWEQLGCNKLADSNQIKKISRGINRGDINSANAANGEAERISFYNSLAKIVL